MSSFLIIGNGPAGTKAATTIRSKDRDSKITIISNESMPFYYRPQLVDSILRRRSLERLLVKSKEFYKENVLDLHLDSRLVEIKPNSKKVILENREEFFYDRLLLATGIYPSFRFETQEGIEALMIKTVEDVERIKAKIKGANSAVLEGDYPFNLELARVLIEKEIDVFFLIREKRLWSRLLDKKASKVLDRLLREKGIEIFYNSNINQIKRLRGRVKEVKTSEDEIIRCEIIGGGDCINPNELIFKNAGLKNKKGLIVDNRLKTELDGIFAAGDVAELDGVERFFGWQRSLRMGEIAGLNLMGGDIGYDEVEGLNLQIFGSDFVLIGDINPTNRENYEELVPDTPERVYKKIVFKDNKVVGAIFIGDIKGKELIKGLIKQKRQLMADERSVLKRQLEEKEEETTSLDLVCPVCKASIDLKVDAEIGERTSCGVCGVELELKKTDVSLVKRLVVV